MNKLLKNILLLLIIITFTYAHAYSQWEQLPGGAKEIAASDDSTYTVWVIGESGAAHKWNESSFSWENFGGTAEKIAVERHDRPWVINKKQIYRLRNRVWQNMPGKAREIASGGGSVWVLGESGEVFKWDENSFSWENFGGNADLIAVDSNGIPWVVNNKQIYRLRGKNWQNMPGKAIAIAAGNGTVWSIGESNQVYKWNDGAFQWENHGGKASKIAVGNDGKPLVIQDGLNARLIYRYNN